MATCLVFTHIPRPAAEELTTCLQVEKVREILQTHMSEVPVDLAMDALRLSRRQLWNCEQVSAFLGIILHVVRFDARTSMDTMQQSFDYLKGLVLLHSCERPPWTSGIFTPQEAQELSDFFMQRYFRNYWLFKHLCGKPSTKLDLSIESPGGVQQVPERLKSSTNDYFLSAEEVAYIRGQVDKANQPTCSPEQEGDSSIQHQVDTVEA